MHCEYLECFFDTATFILATRPPRETSYKMAFDYLSAEDEARIQLGMMSDACGQVLTLLRFTDDDNPDVALISAECAKFLQKVEHDWLHGGVLQNARSHTRMVLEKLRIRRTYAYKNELLGVGGVEYGNDSPLVQRCLRRMRIWNKLAATTTHTEYPSFEFCQAFTVLALGDVAKGHRASMCRASHIERLSKFCDIDRDCLEKEMEFYRPAAAIMHESAGMGTCEAWIHSIRRPSRCHKNTNLKAVLKEYEAIAISTHKLDSNFNVVQQRLRPQMKNQAALAELDTVQLLTDTPDMNEAARKTTIAMARCLWGQWFGSVRHSPKLARIDKCTKRRYDPCDTAAAAVKRTRYDLCDTAAAAVAADELGPTHDKELKFQAMRTMQKKVEAYNRNLLLPHEITDEVKEAAAIDKKKHKQGMGRSLLISKKRRHGRAWEPDFHFADRKVYVACASGQQLATWLILISLL